ncbi:MAG: rhomboid family intramembrane serine protease [Xanthobacteraceae bacterium]
MTALLALLAAIHLFRMMLPTDLGEWVIWAFGFVPARYDLPLSDARFPGGAGAAFWSFLSYSLLHADLNHIIFNALWMLPFGSAVARRFGAARFFAFLAVTAIAGAIAHLATHAHEVAPMIGASAAVSGAMAASIRFAFGRGSFLAFGRLRDADSAAQVPALSLPQALRNPRVLAFLGVWFGINIVFGMGSIAIGAPAQSIAWQAHIGGFLAGLVLFSLFDPVAQAVGDDAPSADGFDTSDPPPPSPDDQA